jgi:drug/metabolite transporter (DMT)-like permease
MLSSSSSTNRLPPRWPAVRGGLLALTSAVLFGVSTPLVQRFGFGVGAFATAALLYAGASVAGALLRRRVEREASVVPGDFPRLLAIAAAGAVHCILVGPAGLEPATKGL